MPELRAQRGAGSATTIQCTAFGTAHSLRTLREPPVDRLTTSRAAFTAPDQALAQEWLLTNGLGGFACGTVAQANTRRYHGLLVAALRPPVQRVLMLAKLDALAVYRGRSYALGCNEFADGTLTPQGFAQLASFHLEGRMPVWTFAIGDALLEQRIWMAYGSNTTYVRYRLRHATASMELQLVPLCTYRDYHSHTHGSWSLDVQAHERGCTVRAFEDALAYRLDIDRGRFRADGDWYWRFQHRAESERGLDAEEHLFRPGHFEAMLEPGETLHCSASCAPDPELAGPLALYAYLARNDARTRAAPAGAPPWIRQLLLAADDFLVARIDASGSAPGTTVIAGYPWFSDWGRDTMIALPGLTVPAARLDDAAAVLRTFAQHLDQGMLPNRFPDQGEAAEYNTVDATLWYFHAIDAHLKAGGDQVLLAELYPALQDIITRHRLGTRHGIGVDSQDGLLHAGEPGVQLTWMDAKVGDWVVTPRTGKAVEINALWHFAMCAMARWATALGDAAGARGYRESAAKIRDSFRSRFWSEELGHLHDVIDIPGGGVDSSLRPNQIFAVSLGEDLLAPVEARAVVRRCAESLLTPVGLRSLAPDDPAYAAQYGGGPAERDARYHQGTVWSWLLGPFALAHWRVHGDAVHALALLEASAPHLAEACLGQVSEIFDADAPHAPRGCFAQAWGVAETLRAWHLLSAASTSHTRSDRHASQT